jgi:hypothetical protein
MVVLVLVFILVEAVVMVAVLAYGVTETLNTAAAYVSIVSVSSVQMKENGALTRENRSTVLAQQSA